MPPPTPAEHWIVVGLGFGDEGKGGCVDWLARTTHAGLVVRFNGGPQAAHHVVTPEGVVHCFSQVGAGAFAGAETFLSAPVMVDPLALEVEFRVLEEKGLHGIRPRQGIDPDCPVVTPYHAWLGQLAELARGDRPHGTCGRGLGELFFDLQRPDRTVLRMRDLLGGRLPSLIERLREQKIDQARRLLDRCAHPEARAIAERLLTPEVPAFLVERYRAALAGVRILDWQAALRGHPGSGVIFEGAQGALLDQDAGFFPHVTPSRTTAHPARALLAEMGGEARTLGVLRAYATRHGAGPFVTEEPALRDRLPEPHNPDAGWQGSMRLGWFDAVAARYAIAVNGGIDHLALTCLDRLAGSHRIRWCEAYSSPAGPISDLSRLDPVGRTADLLGCQPIYREAAGREAFLHGIAAALGRPVDLLSTAPDASGKRWLPLDGG